MRLTPFIVVVWFLSLSAVKGGKWVYVDVEYNYKYGYDFGHEPIDRKYIRGEAYACESMELLILDNDDWDNYVFYQLYYYSSYTALLDGGSYKTWENGNILDCYGWKPFWFAWEGNTQSMGFGLEPHQNTYLSSDFGRTISANILNVAMGQSHLSGQWRWLQDDPPLFLMPSPDGNEILELSESTSQYAVVYTPSGEDNENDAITFTTDSQNTDYFAVYSGSTYLMKNLDYETSQEYLVTFLATCEYNSAKNTMLVRVINEYDEQPEITTHAVVIPEGLDVGTHIGTAFTVVDRDIDDTLTYSISGSHQEYLDVDSSTGMISIKKLMDADTTNFDFSGLTFTATDLGGLQMSKSFDLTIYDINDNIPVFSQEYYEVTVDDGISSGSILTLAVTDADFDNQGITTSIMSQDGGKSGFSFSISGNVISVTSVLDYESREGYKFEYILVIQAVDSPPYGAASTGIAGVAVKISPINEHTPSWSSTPSGGSVSEGIIDLALITTISATDSDLGDDGRITYLIASVTPNSGADLFAVDSESGEVTVGGHLDADTATGGTTSYTVRVGAADNGPTPKTIYSDITVILNGVNDNAPIFDQTEYVANYFDEGSVTTLIQPVLTDHDGDTVTLTIVSGNDGGQFSVDGHTVKVVSALDYETQTRHSLVLRASDGVHTTDAAVTINVNDVIDENPVISIVTTTSMAEEQTIGTRVSAGIVATDPDVSDVLTYSISGSGSAYLNIDSSNGELTVSQNVDYESGVTQIVFTLTVTDTGGNQDSETITITVDDINDKFPVFNPSVYDAEVTENSGADTVLLTLTCTDTDTGTNAQFDLSVDSGDGGTGVFKISGQQLLTTGTAVDYEALAANDFVYTLVITAVDKPGQGAANTGSALVTVRVKSENEFYPVWTAPSSDGSGNFDGVSISEGDTPGKVVTTFQASDDDLGLDGVLTYSIISVTAASGASGAGTFAIDLLSGELTVAGPLDVDAGTNGEASYTVTVRAYDIGANPKHLDGVIVVTLTNINDNPPFFDQTDYSADVGEDSGVGSAVITINTDDYDGDAVTLSIVSGPSDLFVLDGSDVKVKAALDYETAQVHVLVIRASDGVFDTDVSLQINVLDVIDEPPVITMVTSATMSEEQAIETGVNGGYFITDPDAGDTLTYSLSGADSSYLAIDSATGELSIAQNVNREGTGAKGQMDLTLTVTDLGGQQATQAFTIAVEDINDLAPNFNPSEFTAVITENSAADISLLDLTCTDGDEGDNALFDVTVASGDGGAGVFKMSGLQLQTDSNPPNYEALGSSGFMYTLIITAVDKPGHGEPNTGTAIVRVTVNPENEFTPVWTNAIDGSGFFNGVTVSEGDPPGTVIGTFTATDNDLGVDGAVSYSIVSVTGDSGAQPTDKFSIDSSIGDLMVAGALDVDAGTGGETAYTVVIRASDGATSPLHVDGSIVLTLTNINDNAPTFDQTDYSSDMSEASAVGTVVITLNTDDYDGDTVTLSVVSGGGGLFECDGSDVKIKAALDYETSTFHVLTIRASDGVFDTDVPLTVFVLDASDEVPIITMVTTATMSEEQAMGTYVYGGLMATDADVADTISYSLSGADSSYLTVNSSTGKLFIADHVDREGSIPKTQLDLTLTVTDGVLSDTQSFTITVEDINDSPSIFSPSEYSVEVTENTAADVSLLDLTCSDVDTGKNAEFDVVVASGDGGAGIFKMSGLQLLTSGTPADYEAVTSTGFLYTLIVTAVDKPDHGEANTGSAIVRVTVKPVNEHTPVWTAPISDGSGTFDSVDVNENSPPETLVTTFQATDSDEGADGDITYSIVSITSDTTGTSVPGIFSMDASTGQMMVSGELDSDLNTGGHVSYTVAIRASDGGTTPNTVDGTIVITPNNVNDNAPTFTQSQYQADVSEDSAVGAVVVTFSYDDFDGDSVTLSVVSGRTDLFETVGDDLKVKVALDYETETTHVAVVRANDGVHDTDVSVEINVVDVFDEPPIITMVTTSSVAEEQTKGTAVDGGYVVTDPDAGDTVSYSLSGADSGYLIIESATGGLTVAQNMDREAGKTSLSLTLTVTDQAGLQATQDFTLAVEDINDRPPLFSPTEYTVEVTENTAADTSLLDLTCTDDDIGNNAVFVVSVEHGDDSTAKFKFSGQQLQTTSTAIDYDALEASGFMYTLVITAVDTPDQGDSNTGTAVVIVTVKPVNEHTPTWTAPDASGTFTGISVSEEVVPGTTLTTFQASDDDRGDDGVVKYNIVSVTGDTTGTSLPDLFSMDATTGQLKVAAELDHDLTTGGEISYTVVVRASDSGTTPNTVDGTIVITPDNVNDNAPAFVQTEFQTDLNEDSAVGDIVITPGTNDADGDSVTLTIISGGDGFFEIDGSDVKVKATLDFETKPYYVIFIKASDGKYETVVSLQIDLVDIIDEYPIINMVTTSSVAEEQTIGTAVYGGYSVTEPDAQDDLTYALSGDDSAYLAIDSSTGDLTVAQNIDREGVNARTSLTLTLTVTDLAGLQAIKDFTITVEDINDLPPTFDPYEYAIEVTENTAFDTELLQLTCTDDDSDVNANFDAALVSGDDTTKKFKLSGLKLLTDANSLDYESLEASNYMYTLFVEAVDTPTQGDPKTGTASIKVIVKPENEDYPVWSAPHSSGVFEVTIAEGTAPGSILTTYAATDNDHGIDGDVTYSIVSVTAASGATGNELFAVDSSTGVLILTRQADYDTGTNGEESYSVVIKAEDGGTPSKAIEGSVTVLLTNVNDNPPVFDQVSYQKDVNEDKAVGSVVISLNTEDYDNDAVTFSIASGRNDVFEVNGNDVIVKDVLDYENERFYVLIIRASDGLHDTDVPVHINVMDIIDEAPVITMVTTTSMSEEQTIGTPVYAGYNVSDPDVNDVLTYSLSGADSSYLTVDSATGELTLTDHVDREGASAKSELTLTLTVTDQAGLQAAQGFTITVEDINDLPPIFDQLVYEIEVPENTVADTELLDLVCTDGDTGQNAVFTVDLLSGDDTTPKFKISNSKLLAEANPTDFESGIMYVLIITAVDNPDQGVANTGTTVVIVKITADNDFAPEWTDPASDGTGTFNGIAVSEDSVLGTVVTTFQATDGDDGADGVVIYSIVSVTGDTNGASLANLFTIDSSTGQLKVGGELDSDLTTGGEISYTVVVRASDSGTTPNIVDGTIVITPDMVNDNAPTFVESEFQTDVNEDSAVGAAIITLGTDDADGDAVTLTIFAGRTDLFELDGNEVKVKDALDYETDRVHLLFIKASDGTFETTVSLKINIIDVIDETPVITMVTTGSMSEGQIIDTAVSGGYKITDSDAQDELVYALSGADSHYLSINESTGELTVAEHVDRDGTSGVTELTDLTLTVTDLAGLQATQAFTITVVDINDITPTFDPAEYTVEITENTVADTSLIDLTCTDGDEGKNAEFDIVVGGGDDTAPKFKMVGNQVQTESTAVDYETLKDSGYKYTLYITAVDKPDQGDPNTGTAVVIVTVKPVNEHTPEWTDPTNDGAGTFNGLTVSEALSPGEVVATFTATDADHGADGQVAYSIVSISGDTTGTSLPDLFSMEASTGKLTIGEELDHDLTTGGEISYTVVVRASDSGTTPNTVDGTIVITPDNVNDNAPTFVQTEFQTDVNEDSAVGASVITLGTEDPDGDAVTLTIISGGDDRFEIDGNDVKVKARLDFETRSFYVLVLKASDGKFETEVSLEITVVDIVDENPIITIVETPSMSEEQINGTGVYGGYIVTDPDANDTLTYSLSGADSSYLTIDSATGELTVAQAVDREGTNAKTSLSLTLTVTDLAGLQATQDFTITVTDINDLPPSCDPEVFSAEVAENSAADLLLLDLTCADYDYGNNAVFSVSIGSGDDTDPKFKMVGKELMTTANPIDYESLTDAGYLFTLIIIAVDGPDQGNPNTGTAVVKVKVTPINEHAPEWSDPLPDANDYLPDVTVDEDEHPGTVITTVSAVDADKGEDGKVRYEVNKIILDDGSDAAGTFVIGYESGELQVKSKLDAESSVYYDVSIRAFDGGNPAKEDTLGIKVYVNNVNDMPPAFDQDKYTTEVAEDTAIDTTFFTLTATDPDGDALTFAVDGDGSDMFECRGYEIVLLKKLDFETDRYHSIIISANDGIHTVYVSLIVNVINVMDEPPSISASDYSLPEGLLTGTVLGNVFSVDDDDPFDVFQFSLSGENSDKLDIDATTGALSIKSIIDGDAGLTLLDKVTVTVTDQGGQSASKDLTFTILDVNDNVPTFSNTSHEVSVDEGGSGDMTLMEFTVTDADPGANGDFDISVVSGDDSVNPVFSIVGTALHMDAGKVDYEELTAASYKYTLTIAAVDKPEQGQALTGSTLVTVKVTSKNEFSPEWVDPTLDGTDNFPNVTVPELTKFDTIIANFTATDGDAGPDGTIVYRIQSITDSNGTITPGKFVMLTQDDVGQVVLSSQLDADEATGGVPFYKLVISASDSGITPRTITGTLIVNVEDEYEPVPTETVMITDAETWALRGSLMGVGAGLGVAGILAAKHLMKNFKGFDKKKGPGKVKPKFERHKGHEDELSVEEVEGWYEESVLPAPEKIRPPR